MRIPLILIVQLLFLTSCIPGKKENGKVEVQVPSLPYMGEYDLVTDAGGKTDTVYHTIPPFSFTSQDGAAITEKNYEGKVYLADFFFTTCPSICPKMATTLGMVQEALRSEKDFRILSHTIDPDHDTPAVLKKYAESKRADTAVWTFVTGDKDEIYSICEYDYMAFARPDLKAEGGFVHSGFLVLVDKQKHIRGVYDGTRAELVDSIVNDVKRLLHE